MCSLDVSWEFICIHLFVLYLGLFVNVYLDQISGLIISVFTYAKYATVLFALLLLFHIGFTKM